MWDPQHLTTLWGYTGCCGDIFTLFLFMQIQSNSSRRALLAGQIAPILTASFNKKSNKERQQFFVAAGKCFIESLPSNNSGIKKDTDLRRDL
jgi:hypothetical protein